MTRGFEVVPFEEAHIPGAAQVLGRRHDRHRSVNSFLPEAHDLEGQIRKCLDKATGSVAISNDEVVGYLVGATATDEIGEHIWSPVAAHAVNDPIVAQDLYAAAAERWVDEGLRRHFVFVPAIADIVEPWIRLCFGRSAVWAARSTSDIPQWSASDFTVRPATAADTEVLAALHRELYQHLQTSPSFSGRPLGPLEEFVGEWAGFESDQDFVVFVAESSGEVVGQVSLYRRPTGDLRVPLDSIDLAGAATLPSYRGRGICTALTWSAIAWARDQGIATVITDWRQTNLIAARCWPRFGFVETHLRLYRSIP